MDQAQRPRPELKERLGAFIHHPAVSLVVVALIFLSVSLVLIKLLALPTMHWAHPWIEWADLVITIIFVFELGTKWYVADDRLRFLAQYWIDIVAILPWAHSLRVLRILRLLRVFRVAIILSRRVRFVSALFRSALGEYVVLGMIMFALLAVGTFALYLSERQHRERAGVAAATAAQPDASTSPEDDDLSDPENALWATVFFLVATEPMLGVPKTAVGKAVALVVMFGGLTTFAVFTGIVTALMVNRLKRRMEIDDMDRFHLNDHLIICGWNRLVPLIIEELMLSPGGMPAVVIVADLDEPPEAVSRLGAGARVYFVRGDYTRPDVLEQARVRFAERAIIVADSTRERSDQDRDARTVLGALMIEKMNPQIYTCAELLNRDNEHHLRAAGVEEVITTSEAGGHHLAIAAMHAGLAQVLDELLTVKVGHNLVKLAVGPELVGLAFVEALDRVKRAQGDLVIGLEVRGRDGPRAEGYQMLINPSPDLVLGERDNLVLISGGKGRARS